MENKNQDDLFEEYEDETYEIDENCEEQFEDYLDWDDDQWSEDEFDEYRYTLVREKIDFPPSFKPFIPDYSKRDSNWVLLSPENTPAIPVENLQKISLPKKNWDMNLLTEKQNYKTIEEPDIPHIKLLQRIPKIPSPIPFLIPLTPSEVSVKKPEINRPNKLPNNSSDFRNRRSHQKLLHKI